MKFISGKYAGGETFVTVRRGVWPCRKVETFRTEGRKVTGSKSTVPFFNWLRTPGDIQVPLSLSFKLDTIKQVNKL